MKRPASKKIESEKAQPSLRADKTRPSIFATYQQHLAALKRYVVRILHVESDVEDVVQEAFIRAYQAESGGEILQPKSYLFRVAKHVALNQLRQKVNRPTDYLEDSDLSSVLVSEWTLEDEILAHERLGFHCAAVSALPPRRRKVYLLRKVYGMSHKEISANLGITTSTVEAHLVKGYRECQAYVQARMTATAQSTAAASGGEHSARQTRREIDNG